MCNTLVTAVLWIILLLIVYWLITDPDEPDEQTGEPI